MPFITTMLPNGGNTGHFSISYEDSLSQEDGLDPALGLLQHCESDLQLIASWFPGVNFQFAFPISVQITGGPLQGAGWTDPPDIALWFGFHPSVDIMAGARPSTAFVRYLLVAEVTEMYMASQKKDWFGSTTFSGAVEGSMGESLSRFLASQFLSTTGISKVVFPRFGVAGIWLNEPTRPDFVNTAPNDIQPDPTTGCGTCFIFFLHDQLGHSIQAIIAAAGPTLAGVYKNLTGQTDGWAAFKNLVDLHYPQDGTTYSPPLDNVFPAADLHSFTAPQEMSWAVNGTPNAAWLFLTKSIPVDVKVTLTSDDPQTITVPNSVLLMSSSNISLTVPAQSAAFTTKIVHVTASYAGKQMTAAIKVVRPENLAVARLVVAPVQAEDPCAQHFVEGTPLEFEVKNPGVVVNHTGLTYSWSVNGAVASTTNSPILTIPMLPAAGTTVSMKVTLSNASKIRSEGTYTFTTVQGRTGLAEELRMLNCSLRNLRAINDYIPPWIPVEEWQVRLDPEELVRIGSQAERVSKAANQVSAAVKAIRATEG